MFDAWLFQLDTYKLIINGLNDAQSLLVRGHCLHVCMETPSVVARSQQQFPDLQCLQGWHQSPMWRVRSNLDAENAGHSVKQEWDSQTLCRQVQAAGVKDRLSKCRQQTPVCARTECNFQGGVQVNL